MASYCQNLKGLIVHVGDLNFKDFELEGVRLHAWHRRVIYSYCLFVARYLRQLSYLCELFIGRKYNYIQPAHPPPLCLHSPYNRYKRVRATRFYKIYLYVYMI